VVAAEIRPEDSGRVRVPKTAELVAAKLRRRIISGDLQEGDVLPSELALQDQFGVSRPTLREAFRLLESEGLIVVRRGANGGARVQVPSADVAARYAGLMLQYRGTTLADVYEARAALEPTCAGMLAKRRTAAQLRNLWQNVNQAEKLLDDPAAGVALQQEFHRMLVDFAGNETLRILLGMLHHIIDQAAYSKVVRDAGPPSRTAMHVGHRAHRQLTELIEAKNAEGAERLWRKHGAETSDYLLKGAAASTIVELIG